MIDQTRKPLLSLSTFFYTMGFLNTSLSGYFVHPYNISTFWKPFLWCSPLHLSWITLVLNEFGQNYKYGSAQLFALEGIDLWISEDDKGIHKMLLEPQEMIVVMLAAAILLRALVAVLFTFRKLR